jgi:hypothetical protein
MPLTEPPTRAAGSNAQVDALRARATPAVTSTIAQQVRNEFVA